MSMLDLGYTEVNKTIMIPNFMKLTFLKETKRDQVIAGHNTYYEEQTRC